jgi:TRAP transporter TAXI family solute receptor
MKKMRFLCIIGTVVLLVGLGCSAAIAAEKIYFTIGGAGSQGRWYAEVSCIAKLLTEKMPNVTATGVVSPGVSRGNINRMAKGELQAGRLMADDFYAVVHKLPPFDKGAFPVKAWFKVIRQPLRVVADISIKKSSDLKGKKIALGVRGSGDDTIAWRYLNFLGIKEGDVKVQYIGRKEALAAFTNHQVDAVIMSFTRNNQGYFGPVFAARPFGKSAHFLAPTMEEAKQFSQQWPCYIVDVYGEPDFGAPDLIGVTYETIFAIHEKVDEKLAYEMTKIIFDNWDTVVTQALPWFKPESESKKPGAEKDLGASLQKAMDIPGTTAKDFHPGALRYYKEKGVAK